MVYLKDYDYNFASLSSTWKLLFLVTTYSFIHLKKNSRVELSETSLQVNK